MTPSFVEFVGSGAACLTTAAFFPQAIKTIRERKTDGLSLSMYLMLVLGVAMWLTYGIFIGSWPLIIANAVSILPQLAILFLMLVQIWNGRFAAKSLPLASPEALIAVRKDSGAVGA
ncbi:MAG: SemiSWEET transporter [Hyphomicrobiales bacterium]|nr:SemiSWEET transporter [Hyphomicrobiales bacterium]